MFVANLNCQCYTCSIPDEGMRVLTQMETIHEGVAIGMVPPACSEVGTPQPKSTPITIPRTNGSHHHPPGRYHLGGTDSAIGSPSGLLSQVSLQSCREVDADDDGIRPSATTAAFASPSSAFGRTSEKFGRWLRQHGSRLELQRTASLHGTFAGLFSKQTSVIDDNVEADSSTANRTSSVTPPPPKLDPFAELFSTCPSENPHMSVVKNRPVTKLFSRGGKSTAAVMENQLHSGKERADMGEFRQQQQSFSCQNHDAPHQYGRYHVQPIRDLDGEDLQVYQSEKDQRNCGQNFAFALDERQHRLRDNDSEPSFSHCKPAAAGTDHFDRQNSTPASYGSRLFADGCSFVTDRQVDNCHRADDSTFVQSFQMCDSDFFKASGRSLPEPTSYDGGGGDDLGRSSGSCLMPTIVVSSPATNHLAMIDSCSSIMGYDSPESSQSTVTSITPLLKESTDYEIGSDENVAKKV